MYKYNYIILIRVCYYNNIHLKFIPNSFFNFLEPHSVLSIPFPELPITRSGDPVHLECIISKIVPGFANFVDIFWLGSNYSAGFLRNVEGASINTTLTNSNQTLSRLSINHFNTSQAGIYTCIGSLNTNILAHPILISKEQVLAVHSK